MRQAPARPPRGDQGRGAPVHLGVLGVAEPQLESGAEQVTQAGPQVGPASSADHQVHTEAQTALSQVLQLPLQVPGLPAHARPAVHDHEDVAEPVVAGARLAVVEDPACLGDGAPNEAQVACGRPPP